MIESKLDPWPVQALEATLGLPTDRAAPPTELPPLWHWLYFLPTAPRTKIGPDGHMVNQEWVDSTLRRRRLFAAARTDFLRPLRIGVSAQMQERVIARQDKQGRSGAFHLVTAEYQYFQGGELCVREERDIVYLQGPARARPASEDDVADTTSANGSWLLSLRRVIRNGWCTVRWSPSCSPGCWHSIRSTGCAGSSFARAAPCT